MESKWKTLKYENTQLTGPAKAIEAEVRKLKAAGTEYEVTDYKPVRYVEELETREEENGSK